MDAKIIRRIAPAQYDVEQLVTFSGMAFTFRVRPSDGGIFIAFNDDLASVKARIGKVTRPGKPIVRRKD